MFKQKKSEKQKSTQNSTTFNGYREKESIQGSIVLPLQPASRRYRPKQTTDRHEQSSCKTQRDNTEQKSCRIELVLNNKSFQIDCSECTLIESQLKKIFSDSSVKQNIRKSISLIILERARRVNKNITTFFQKTIEAYQKEQLEMIETEITQV